MALLVLIAFSIGKQAEETMCGQTEIIHYDLMDFVFFIIYMVVYVGIWLNKTTIGIIRGNVFECIQ